jgi:hypothetical protein
LGCWFGVCGWGVGFLASLAETGFVVAVADTQTVI